MIKSFDVPKWSITWSVRVGNSPVGATVRVTVLRRQDPDHQGRTWPRRRADGAVPGMDDNADEGAEAEPQSTMLMGLTLMPLTDELAQNRGR